MNDELFNREEPELVIVENGEFVFVGQWYSFEVDRVKTRAQIIEWLHHLMGKEWITVPMLMQFLEKACAQNGLDIYSKRPA